MKKNKKNILIISDTQFPYERADYLKFCKSVEKKYNCGRVIHIGDVADCLNFSNYERDPECPSIPDEVSNLKKVCLLYTSDAADDTPCVDLGGRRIIKKKK